MTFLTIFQVTEILCSFKLVQEGKTGKEIPESSRLVFLEKFSENFFALSDTEDNISRLLNREGNWYWFFNFWPFSQNVVPTKVSKTTKSPNEIPAEFEIFFFLTFDQSLILIPAYPYLYLLSCIRASVTYLIISTLINNREIDFQWHFRLFLLISQKLNIHVMFSNHQITKLNSLKM